MQKQCCSKQFYLAILYTHSAKGEKRKIFIKKKQKASKLQRFNKVEKHIHTKKKETSTQEEKYILYCFRNECEKAREVKRQKRG